MKEKRAYLKRTMSDTVRMVSEHFPCLLLTGARQVGKSTLLRRIMPKGMRYVSLDSVATARAARMDPEGFLKAYGTPLCIDEIQYAPELMRAIKAVVDEDRHNGMYWLTGSQRFHLMEGLSESLAGRLAVLELYSLSQRESLGKGGKDSHLDPENPAAAAAGVRACSTDALFERILRGGYPEMVNDPGMPADVFFNSYVNSYLERDVSALTQVGDKGAFLNLMRIAAHRTGEQLSYANIAQDAGISPSTAKRWLSILETSGIITLLRPYYTNSTKRLVKTPKMHFMDSGLCAWLAGITTARQLRESPMAGHIVESWVFSQLLRGYANSGRTIRLSYFRDKLGHEVDMLLEENGKLYPIEVKMNASPALEDLGAVRHIPAGRLKIGGGIIICDVAKPLPLGLGNIAIPISAI